jgi:tripartite-type tricarboxylate transporter receptor subunit TctC
MAVSLVASLRFGALSSSRISKNQPEEKMSNKMQWFAGLVVSASCLWGAWANAAGAPADYPSRPIRVIVPFAAGGGSDLTARYVGQRLSDKFGHPVVIDNRPAASGILGTELVANAIPDGYTLLLVFSTHAQSAQLFTKLPYDPIKDFAPVTEVISTPLVMLINPLVPAKTVPEFIAHAKANPGKLNYGTSGPGSSPHLAAELFASMAGIKMTHIPYKGVAPYITAELGNEVQLSYANMFSTMPHWKSGRLRLIAVSGPTRSQAIPDVPTIAETLPGPSSTSSTGKSPPSSTRPRCGSISSRRATTRSPIRRRSSPESSRPTRTSGARSASASASSSTEESVIG